MTYRRLPIEPERRYDWHVSSKFRHAQVRALTAQQLSGTTEKENLSYCMQTAVAICLAKGIATSRSPVPVHRKCNENRGAATQLSVEASRIISLTSVTVVTSLVQTLLVKPDDAIPILILGRQAVMALVPKGPSRTRRSEWLVF